MAVITGMFPVLGQKVVNEHMFEYTKKGDNWEARYVTPYSGDFAFQPQVQSVCLNQTSLSPWGYQDYHFGPYAIVMAGSPTPVPPDRILSSKIIRVNNRPYLKRQALGEIVVSDFQRFQAYLSFTNGGVLTPLGDRVVMQKTTQTLLSQGFIAGQNWFNGQCATQGAGTVEIGGSFNITYERQSKTDSLTAYDVGWRDEPIEDFLNTLYTLVDSSGLANMVMGVLSEANRQTVDILTAAAELPETIVGCLNGLRAVLKIFKDAKRREFSLLTKEKKIKVEHEERIFRINYESRVEYNAARNERSRRIVEKRRQQAIAQARADLKKTLSSLADAIASVWLNFRYNIMPNVYLIEDLIKANDNWLNQYERWSDLERVQVEAPDVPGFTKSGSVSLEVRVFLKRHFTQVNGLNAALRHFSANIFLTAYELIPLSFVLDWVIPIGNLLSASLGSNHVDYKQASTISYKVSDSRVLYQHTDSGATVEVVFKGYKREVINPSDYCQLLFVPDITPVRTYDAVALAWSIAVSKLFKSL